MKWFKHQSDANLNAKLQEVILDHGMEGYGLYWFCLELVAMNVTSTKLNFELEHDARIIGRMSGMPVAKVEQLMKSFIELDLFEASNGRVQCLKLAKRCDDFTAKALRQNPPLSLGVPDVRQSPTKSDKVPLEDRSKKIEDRSKKVEKSRFAPPTTDEVLAYMSEKGFNDPLLAERFVDFYESKGWMVGRNKMKSWQAAVRNWLKDKKQQQPQPTRPRAFGQ